MAQITQILGGKFRGGKNLNVGSMDAPDADTLEKLLQALITQGNASDAAVSRGGVMQSVEWTDPALADVDFFVDGLASSDADETVNSGTTEWQNVDELDPPRNVTITTTSHSDIDAVAVVITGKVRDSNGDLIDQTDTITLTNDGNTTDAGTKAFSIFQSAFIPLQTGTGGELDFGFGDIIGLPSPMKTRAGLLAPIREISDGVELTTGTFTTAAAKPPNGTYLGAQTPDGAEDYSLFYETDL
jgi:hypothetical protein